MSGVSIFDILKKEIEALHEDEAVGMVQLNRYDDWGKGYTVEGMRALMEHAVKVYGARTFEGECAKENIGSRKVMEKLGMVYDHSSSYTKNDGSATFESDIFTLTYSVDSTRGVPHVKSTF